MSLETLKFSPTTRTRVIIASILAACLVIASKARPSAPTREDISSDQQKLSTSPRHSNLMVYHAPRTEVVPVHVPFASMNLEPDSPNNMLEENGRSFGETGEAIVLDMEAERLEHPPLSWNECAREVNRRAHTDYSIDLDTIDPDHADTVYVNSDIAFENLGREVANGSHPENGIFWSACSSNISTAMQLARRNNNIALATQIFADRLNIIRTESDPSTKEYLLEELLGNTFSTYPELISTVFDNLTDSEKLQAQNALDSAIALNRTLLHINQQIIDLAERYQPHTNLYLTREIVEYEDIIRQLELVRSTYFPNN